MLNIRRKMRIAFSLLKLECSFKKIVKIYDNLGVYTNCECQHLVEGTNAYRVRIHDIA